MLESLKLVRYKAFRTLSVTFEKWNVLVGPNNAGKSTIMEALGIVAHSLKQVRNASYRQFTVPNGEVLMGFNFTLPETVIADNLRHNYEPRTTEVVATFDDGFIARVIIPTSGEPYLLCYYDDSNIQRGQYTPRDANKRLFKIPPVGPFSREEEAIQEKTIRSAYGTHLTPSHFRAYWFRNPEEYPIFRQRLLEFLPTIQLDHEVQNYDKNVFINYREGDFCAEIAWSGSGLQIWMQLLTHIMAAKDALCVLLDEPDIYLHADLQRKLCRLLMQEDKQVILATHAVDIIEEFGSDCIVVVDKEVQVTSRLSDNSGMQLLMNKLGASANVRHAAVVRAKALLMVEGEDLPYIKAFAGALGLDEILSGKRYSTLPIEGFGNWRYLIHTNWIVKNLRGEPIILYLVLDRDYKTQAELELIQKTLRAKHVRTRIWDRKEIENYLLEIIPLTRAINLACTKKKVDAISQADIETLLLECTEEMKDELSDNFFHGFRSFEPNKGKDKDALQYSRDQMKSIWTNLWSRLGSLGGKEVLSRLNDKLQTKYGVSVNPLTIARGFKKEEVPKMVRDVLREIERDLQEH